MPQSLFFITGTSGAGKSTLVDYLQKDLASFEIHDFDEGGVPTNTDVKWRQERTMYWLERAKSYQNDGKSTVICGVSVPEEIQNSPAYDSSLHVHYGLIRIGEPTIRTRLKNRGWDKQEIDDNVHWARHLEKCVKAEEKHCIVDGEESPRKVAEKIRDWIVSETSR